MARDDEKKSSPVSPKKGAHGKGDDTGGSGRDDYVRMAHDIGSSTNWSMLVKSNYTKWALVMKVKLQARNLWETIELGGALEQEDRLALDAITNVVP